jgi:hypothetical protein
MSKLEEAIKTFQQNWGFDPTPMITQAIENGEYDLEGGTEDQRAFIRKLLSANRGSHSE